MIECIFFSELSKCCGFTVWMFEEERVEHTSLFKEISKLWRVAARYQSGIYLFDFTYVVLSNNLKDASVLFLCFMFI